MYVSAKSMAGFGLIPLPLLKLTPIKVNPPSVSSGISTTTSHESAPPAYTAFPTTAQFAMPVDTQQCVECRAWNPVRNPKYDPCAALCKKVKD